MGSARLGIIVAEGSAGQEDHITHQTERQERVNSHRSPKLHRLGRSLSVAMSMDGNWFRAGPFA